jgi:hypothetical protein
MFSRYIIDTEWTVHGSCTRDCSCGLTAHSGTWRWFQLIGLHSIGDRRSDGRMVSAEQSRSTRRKSCPNFTSCTTNPTSTTVLHNSKTHYSVWRHEGTVNSKQVPLHTVNSNFNTIHKTQNCMSPIISRESVSYEVHVSQYATQSHYVLQYATVPSRASVC